MCAPHPGLAPTPSLRPPGTDQIYQLLIADLPLVVALCQGHQHVELGGIQGQLMAVHQAGERLHPDEAGVFGVELWGYGMEHHQGSLLGWGHLLVPRGTPQAAAPLAGALCRAGVPISPRHSQQTLSYSVISRRQQPASQEATKLNTRAALAPASSSSSSPPLLLPPPLPPGSTLSHPRGQGTPRATGDPTRDPSWGQGNPGWPKNGERALMARAQPLQSPWSSVGIAPCSCGEGNAGEEPHPRGMGRKGSVWDMGSCLHPRGHPVPPAGNSHSLFPEGLWLPGVGYRVG